ncbi:right-handed parallel beta-helix repeat-containing protein [Pseudonocardia acaciae]|uniref:right-handed parallel beta-helix repeat-containing protein n=1 Tax=Pseudonocardia acaciae TaxID=551276 RepID=UPI0006862A90|nr:right-handed parallel beta-helix repeat-containing protein [Pseudonocardia acaciae]
MTTRTNPRFRRTALAAPVVGVLAALLALSGCGGGEPSGQGGGPQAAPPAEGTPLGPGCPKPGTVQVRNSEELSSALANPKPGAVIQMASGTYKGDFAARTSGSQAQPITLCGDHNAVIEGGNKNYAMYLENASYWQLVGFTVRGGQKGVMVDNGQHNLIDSLVVENIQDEGLHLRKNSSDNIVRGNTVRNTGQKQAKFGEGIYVGSAESNWKKYTGGEPDRSDRNIIEGNTVSATTSESVDIKEGTTGGVLRNNKFTGPSEEAESWVNVKGNGWQIIGNTGHGSSKDGFSVHQILDGWGINNTFDNNTAVVDGPGYGINVTKNKESNRVTCGNKAEGAGKGLTNIDCS